MLTPRIGSLFSGYGGLDMAVRALLGGELAWWSDIDPGAIRIMSHHHPGVRNLGDISAVDWSQVEPVDVLTGGFPCQDISVAGKQAGIRPGTRSGLWTQMAYAISQLKPRLVVIENVRNLVSAPAHSDVEPCPGCVGDNPAEHALRALGAVLGDLADLGFDAEWVGLPASAVGAPHGRFREFIAAYPAGQPWEFRDGDGEVAADTENLGHERGGRARGRRTGSADSRLLPTPVARDHKGHNQRHDDTCLTGALLPTPRASDGEKGGPGQRGSSGDLMLPSAVLLPTPTATPYGNNQSDSDGAAVRPSLDATVRQPDRWGKYGHAIRRWEALTRPAPSPTQPSSKGTPQLAPVFSEWMMGLPLGWVTDPAIWEGMLTEKGKPATEAAIRNAQLHALGNGVVWQQAAAALRWLLSLTEAVA